MCIQGKIENVFKRHEDLTDRSSVILYSLLRESHMNHPAAFTQFLSELEDPRQAGKIAYPFFDEVFLTVCAATEGAQGWEYIDLFGETPLEWFQRNGLFHNGLPVHDTIARIISRIQPEQFQNVPVVRWLPLMAILCVALVTVIVASQPFIWSVPLLLRIIWCSGKSKQMRNLTKSPLFLNYWHS